MRGKSEMDEWAVMKKTKKPAVERIAKKIP